MDGIRFDHESIRCGQRHILRKLAIAIEYRAYGLDLWCVLVHLMVVRSTGTFLLFEDRGSWTDEDRRSGFQIGDQLIRWPINNETDRMDANRILQLL